MNCGYSNRQHSLPKGRSRKPMKDQNTAKVKGNKMESNSLNQSEKLSKPPITTITTPKKQYSHTTKKIQLHPQRPTSSSTLAEITSTPSKTTTKKSLDSSKEPTPRPNTRTPHSHTNPENPNSESTPTSNTLN
jgi:hypothetical protein